MIGQFNWLVSLGCKKTESVAFDSEINNSFTNIPKMYRMRFVTKKILCFLYNNIVIFAPLKP
jgi:hypothetical protein